MEALTARDDLRARDFTMQPVSKRKVLTSKAHRIA